VYRRLRVSNPAPLSALLIYGDSAVINASPELFLSLRDRHVVTRPIKGTRPRTGDEALDAVWSRELLESEKDHAELTMIVDLLRNDLGRVSEYRSVRVLAPADLEAHPTVFHLVGTIEGRLRPECTWADLFQATLPGGSITGAPKIRAMQIIDELEPTERSVYCGAIGYIGLDGSLQLNVAIRTMILDRGRIHLFGGGAIVADSDPDDEYDETLAKTAGLARSLQAHGTSGPERAETEDDAE
jgi:para-aminobenzoate synthetase component 1